MEFQKNIGNINSIQTRLERFRDTLEYYSKRNDLSISGIFSLASLNVARRTKEIGIRKALGASVTNMMTLLNKEFAIILLLAAPSPCLLLVNCEKIENWSFVLSLEGEIPCQGNSSMCPFPAT